MTGDSYPIAEFCTVKRGKVTSFVSLACDQRLWEKVFDLPNLRANARQIDSPTGRDRLFTIPAHENRAEKLLVRHYRHGGVYRRIAGDLFANSQRPLNELRASEIARRNGVPTAEIIAIRKEEVIKGLYRFDLFSKEIPNSVDLIHYFAESSLHPATSPPTEESHSRRAERLKEKRCIIAMAAKVIRQMHDAGVYHADLHLKNILVQSPSPISNNPLAFRVFVIDFDKAEVRDHLGLKERMKNITRLERSTQKWRKVRRNISSADKLRFLKAYAENDKPFWENRREIIRRFGRRHILHRLLWRLLRIT